MLEWINECMNDFLEVFNKLLLFLSSLNSDVPLGKMVQQQWWWCVWMGCYTLLTWEIARSVRACNNSHTSDHLHLTPLPGHSVQGA